MPLWPKRRAFVGQFVSGLVGVMLGVFGIWGTPGVAQTGAPVSQILTLDQDRLFAESLYGKALEARLIVATQALAAENRKMEQDLAAEEADLTKKRPTMAASAFQALADAFDQAKKQ
jgi:Skp family chaperone for outer membrane proteins